MNWFGLKKWEKNAGRIHPAALADNVLTVGDITSISGEVYYGEREVEVVIVCRMSMEQFDFALDHALNKRKNG